MASTPDPPYVAVIFTNTRTSVDHDGYAATAQRMEALAAAQPGYLALESVRDPATGEGITVSYWATEDDARAWGRQAEHLVAQRLGRERWYESFELRVATVQRARSSTPPG
jgi:heme-degrading monooxygenase HmoA